MNRLKLETLLYFEFAFQIGYLKIEPLCHFDWKFEFADSLLECLSFIYKNNRKTRQRVLQETHYRVTAAILYFSTNMSQVVYSNLIFTK